MGHFERIRYPDGQISAKYIPDSWALMEIRERINSYEDLMYIRAMADIRVARNLFIPCMFGQRSDRRFDNNQSFDLKLIAKVINSCEFKCVEIFDPHSDVTLALVNNSVKKSSFEYVKRAIQHYHDVNAATHNGSVDPVLISPDAGAYKKVFEYAEQLDLEMIGANKHRSKGGKVDLIFTHDVKDKVCFIIDDLCDGGYTFLVLADALRAKGAREVYLYVSHGIFSKGFGELHKQINRIYTTNSVKDIDMENKDLLEAYPFLPNFLIQFKVI
jgi:ribose-phosphate pyrophosphokinase